MASVLTTLLSARRLIALSSLALATLVLVTVLLQPPRYSSRVSFLPQAKGPQGGLSGFAAQLGVSVPGIEGSSQSPAFYVELATSRAILGAVALSDVGYPGTGQQARRVSDALQIKGDSAERREKTIEELGRRFHASFSQRTGVVTIAATATSPRLAQMLATRIIEEINRFNLGSRQSRAASERLFTEQRLAEVRTDLLAAEQRSLYFLQHNRDYRNSPQLAFELDRLSRDVGVRQQIYATIAQAYEQAKIDEVRDTPLITVIERPEARVKPDSRGLPKKVLLGFLLGAIVGTVVAILRRSLHGELDDPGIRAELLELKQAALADLKRPWRVLTPAR